MVLIRGNHDQSAGDPPRDLGIRVVEDPHHAAPFVLAHRPAPSRLGYVLAGHIHPAITLYGPASLRERLPCFVIGRSRAILPAFGSFTGTARFPTATGDRVFVIAGDELIEPPWRARSCA
jgi:metallophosphoesterase superfamily enzyme